MSDALESTYRITKAERKMENKDIDLDELIARALQKKADDIGEDISQCLSSEDIQKLCRGSISDDKRQAALEHLDKCPQCCRDLAFYCEVTARQEAAEPSAVLAKLKKLAGLLDSLKGKLGSTDLGSLSERVLSVTESVKAGCSLTKLDEATEQIFAAVYARFAGLAVHRRGVCEHDEYNDNDAEVEDIAVFADKLEHKARQLAGGSIKIRHIQLTAESELWLMRQLDRSLQQRAFTLRHFCQDILERINTQGRFRLLPSLGISHCSRQFYYAGQLLKNCRDVLNEPLELFITFAGIYCQHTGLILAGGIEDKRIPEIYNYHADITRCLLLGDHKLNIEPMWPKMGFAGREQASLVADICRACQRPVHYISQMPQQQNCFYEGSAVSVFTAAIAGIIKLAGILDCLPERLPDKSLLKGKSYYTDLAWEYIKNESVDQVTIDPQGQIFVEIRQNYEYPPGYGNVIEKVKQTLDEQIKQIIYLLAGYGIRIPDPVFKTEKTLFCPRHPYLD